MRKTKRLVVAALERACCLTHWAWRIHPSLHDHPLANLSLRLNDRWGLDHWGPPTPMTTSNPARATYTTQWNEGEADG